MYLTFFAVLIVACLMLDPFSMLASFPLLVNYRVPVIALTVLLVVIIRTPLGATGAFEVTIDGELVFSKLASRRLPTEKEILAEVKRRQ